jgi:hypothetical protein
MAKELPFFKFHSNEWLTGDITFEPYDIQGVFIHVCATYWSQDCSITLARLKKRLSSVSEGNWISLIDSGYIKVSKQDKVTISFLDEQINELGEQRQKKVEAGRKGGLAKGKQRLSSAKATLKHIDIDKEIEVDKDVLKATPKHKLVLWIEENAPRVQSLKEPITNEQAEKIKAEFQPDIIIEVFTSMHNHKDITKKISANLTFRNWVGRRDTKPQEKFIPEPPKL